MPCHLHNQYTYIINTTTSTQRRVRQNRRFIRTICMLDESRINTENSIARTMQSERVQAIYFKENLRAIAESAVQRYGNFHAPSG